VVQAAQHPPNACGQMTTNLAARCPQSIRLDVHDSCGYLTIMTA
jgi:hypothetical protein